MDGQEQLEPHARQRLRTALDGAAADIDPASAARLRDARHQALAAVESPRRRLWQWLAMSAPIAAVVALVLLVTGPPPASPPAIAAPADAVRDLDLLTSGETLDLLEDLELIRWLPPARSS